MSKTNDEPKKIDITHRFTLVPVLVLPSTTCGRLVEWAVICCSTHVVLSMAFNRPLMPSPSLIPLCFTPRAHQPRVRMITKILLDIPFLVADQSTIDPGI